MSDPLTRVPGILRPGLRAAINGEPGRFVLPSDGVPGLDWYGERGTVRHFRGAGPIEEYADATILDDPTGSTTGCLAAFCRGLWKLPDLYCRPLLPGGWVVTRQFTHPAIGADFDDCHGNTEAAAWRAAILAHPSLRDLR